MLLYTINFFLPCSIDIRSPCVHMHDAHQTSWCTWFGVAFITPYQNSLGTLLAALFTRSYIATCNMWRHTATHYITLQHAATQCNILLHTATYCYILQQTATLCIATYLFAQNTTLRLATSYNTLQRTTAHCSTLQHTATHIFNDTYLLNTTLRLATR